MSKIIIREYDNTKAVGPEYKNFSVVVPGKVAANKTADYLKFADENGVFECSSITDFEDVIGCVAADSEKRAAVAPAFTNLHGAVGHTVDAIEYYQTYRGELYYTGDPITGAAAKEGYLKASLTVAGDTAIYPLIAAPLTDDGYNEDTTYYRIIKGKEGADAVEKLQNGNQIAYELIKLGYTVLFKAYTDVTELDQESFWTPLKDKANYDFRYITTGGYFSTAAAAQIAKIAAFKNKPAGTDDYLDSADEYAKAGRGDCLALIDVDEDDTDIQGQTTQAGILTGIQKYTNKITDDDVDALTKECKVLVPQVIFDYVNPKYASLAAQTTTTTTLPASFYYLACANKAFTEYNEWYAVAGYQRGICDLKVAGTTLTLGDAAVNVLQPRKASKIGSSLTNNFIHAVNPVIKVRKAYYLWGNRTAAPLLDADTTAGSDADLKASHFTNIRQLCITLKKQLYVACRKFTFDPNSDILWVNFCNVIRPTLEKMKADQGITDYKFIKVKNKRKALLTAKIRIVPIEAVEDFDISIYLEDSISGVTVSAEEVND